MEQYNARTDLDEALVEREIVSYGVLPALLVLGVVREVVHNELVDLTQRQLLVGRLGYGHGDQCNVRVRRLYVFVSVIFRVHCSEQRLFVCVRMR